MRRNYTLRLLILLTILYGSNVNNMAIPWSDLISKGIQLIASNPEKATEIVAAIIHKFSSRDTVAVPLEQNKADTTECVSKPEEKKDPIPPVSSKPEKELAPGAPCVNFPEPSLNINKCPIFKDKNEQEISSICESSKIKEDTPKGSCGGVQLGESYAEETNQDSSQELQHKYLFVNFNKLKYF